MNTSPVPTSPVPTSPVPTSPVPTSTASTSAGHVRSRSRFLQVVAEPQTYRNLAYLLLGLPLGTLWLSVLSTGLAVGASLLVVALTGIPFLLGVWYVSRAFANTERITANVLLGTDLGPAAFGPHGHGNPWRRLRALSADPQRIRELWYLLLRFPAGVATFTVAVTALTVPLSLAYAPLAARITGDEPFGDWSHSEQLERIFDSAWSWGAVPVAALVLLVSLHLTNAVARACARWAERSLRVVADR